MGKGVFVDICPRRKELDTSGHDLIFCYVTVGLAQGSQLE